MYLDSLRREMEFFVITVYSFKCLTIFIENSLLDVLRVLDPPLITSGLLTTSNKLIFCRLLKYKIISLENGYIVEASRENLYFYKKCPSSTGQIIYVIKSGN